MLALHMPQFIRLAAENAFDLISSGEKLNDDHREAMITQGLCAANLMLEMNLPGSERAVPIFSALVRAWSDDENVRASLLLAFPRAGERMNELKKYMPGFDVANVPPPDVAKMRIAMPAPTAPSERATFDVQARRWIEPDFLSSEPEIIDAPTIEGAQRTKDGAQP